jgi:8-amino-7-oxononanoate synthase
MKNIDKELYILAGHGLLRELTALPRGGGKFDKDGQVVYNLGSNDYLNLAQHPAVKAGAIEAIQAAGGSASASRLMSGHLDLHQGLEEGLAAWAGTEAALIFGSGFLANLGVLQALVGDGDLILADKLNHASLVDGMRYSAGRWYRYRHKDLEHLEALLKRRTLSRHKYIVSDAVFSMDGDQAPLAELGWLAEKYDATLIIDEAHSFGVLGDKGGGLCRTLPLAQRPAVVVGTLSKALGSYGGFVGCSSKLRSYLLNKARSFIYSTALPPACVGGAVAALAVLKSTPDLGARLMDKVKSFYARLKELGFQLKPLESQIIPILVGDNQQALTLAQALRTYRIIAPAIRPPTVPPGTARLRLSVTLAHLPEDLAYISDQLAKVARQSGLV